VFKNTLWQNMMIWQPGAFLCQSNTTVMNEFGKT